MALRLDHCNVAIIPQERIQLYCEPAFRHLYKLQELLIAICPACNKDVMGWIGIDAYGKESDLVRIKPKKQPRWLLRAETESFAEFQPKGVDVVLGSNHSIPYNLRTVLVQ